MSSRRADGRQHVHEVHAAGPREPREPPAQARATPPSTSLWVMGRLGDSEGRGEEAELAPRRVDAVAHAGAAQVSVGPFHAAVGTRGGHVYVWGANFFGQLGRSAEAGVTVDSSPEMAQKFEDIGGVVVDAMDITVRPTAHVPRGPSAQGRADRPCEAECPVAVPVPVRALALVKAYTGHRVLQASCGGAHTVVVCAQGVAFVFGCNAQGQLGTSAERQSRGGTKPPHAKLWSLPSELQLPGVFVREASCGGMHTLLRSSCGQVYSFGEGRNGRLGHGDTKSCGTPTLVEHFVSHVAATSVCAAWAHSIVLDEHGAVWT